MMLDFALEVERREHVSPPRPSSRPRSFRFVDHETTMAALLADFLSRSQRHGGGDARPLGITNPFGADRPARP